MDRVLASAIVDLEIIQFGSNQRNKRDSWSCLFDPRRLLSDPEVLNHAGSRIAEIALNLGRGSALVGMATSGIAWAGVASVKSQLPMMYVRKEIESGISDKLVEGHAPRDRRLTLVDDLLFAGESKRKALEILRREGFEVTDLIVVIDRQLQRCTDGPPLQQAYNLKLHSLIDMADIVEFLIETDRISESQLAELIADYRCFERWDMPRFAR